MGVDFKMKYTPHVKIPHADALVPADFDNEDDSDRVCFASTELESYGIFQDIIKRVAARNRAQKQRKHSKDRKML